MTKPILAYWDIRGLAHQTRLLLHYLGVDYEDKLYDFGPDFKGESWYSEKFKLGLRFPNLPYYIDGKVKLSESMAILKYVAKTRGPETVPATPEDQAVADEVEGVVRDVQEALVTLAYSKTGIPETPLEVKLAPKFEQLEAFLSERKWVVGEQITYVDFFLYEALFEFRKYNKEFLKPYPSLEKFIQALESLPQLSEFIKSTNHQLCYSPWTVLKL